MKRTDIKADGTRYWVADSNTWAEYGEGGPEVLLSVERWQRNRGWTSRTATVADSTGTDHEVYGEPHAAGSHLLMERTYQAGGETIRSLSLVTPAQVRGTEEDCRHQAAEARARRVAGEQARERAQGARQDRIADVRERVAALGIPLPGKGIWSSYDQSDQAHLDLDVLDLLVALAERGACEGDRS